MMTLTDNVVSELIQSPADCHVGELEVVTNCVTERKYYYTNHLLVIRDLETGNFYGCHYSWWSNSDLNEARPHHRYIVEDEEGRDTNDWRLASISFTFEPRPNYILEDT